MTHHRDERIFHPQKVRVNLIKLALGWILWMLSIGYLQSHPAEKISLISGLTIMSQKVHVMISRVIGQDYLLLDGKYDLERRLQDILYTSSFTSNCQGSPLIDELHERIASLKALRLQGFSEESLDYAGYLTAVYRYVSNNCEGDETSLWTDS